MNPNKLIGSMVSLMNEKQLFQFSLNLKSNSQTLPIAQYFRIWRPGSGAQSGSRSRAALHKRSFMLAHQTGSTDCRKLAKLFKLSKPQNADCLVFDKRRPSRVLIQYIVLPASRSRGWKASFRSPNSPNQSESEEATSVQEHTLRKQFV